MKLAAEMPLAQPTTWFPPLVDTGAEQPITFGDRVRVLETEETHAAGLAGLLGSVVGETIPSMSGQKVALRPGIDYAIGVHLEELGRTLFLPHDVLEFISHEPGQQIRMKTSRGEITWVRLESGEWAKIGEPAGQEMPAWARVESGPMRLLRRALRYLEQRIKAI